MDAALRRLVRQRAGDRCEYCRLPQSATPFARFHVEHIIPRQHFRLLGARISGITAVGRATAHLLRMNDKDRVRLRAALLSRGEY